MRRRENLIACGPSGTGKTVLLEALGQQAIDQGMSVSWLSMEDLGALVRPIFDGRCQSRQLHSRCRGLHISQPTLSQQIKQLERILGVQLLDRTGRVVRLTVAGTVYSEHARRILRDLAAGERAVYDVQDLSRGHLRLGLTPTFTAYLIGPLTAEFNTRHPGITLAIKEMSQDRIEPALLAGELDLGKAFAGSRLPGITIRSWFTEVLSLVTCSTNTQSMPKILPVKALGTTQLVLLSEDFATRNRIDAYFARHDIAPRITVKATSIQALTEIVQRSPLATVLPEAITHDHLHLACPSPH